MKNITVRRQRARRGEGERLREQIVEAADRLLAQRGTQRAVSIQDIATEVGCTPPAIYLHFADKRSLMVEVCRRHFARFRDALAGEAAKADDPLASLALRGRAYVRFGLENPERYRILFMHRPGELPEDVADDASEWSSFDELVEAVDACIRARALVGDDAFAVACQLWAVVHGLTALLISKPDFPWPDDFMDRTLATTFGGLAPR